MDIFIHTISIEEDNESLESSRLKVSRFTGRVWDLILLALRACEIFSTPWCLLPSFFLISHLDLSFAFFRMKYALALLFFFKPLPLSLWIFEISTEITQARIDRSLEKNCETMKENLESFHVVYQCVRHSSIFVHRHE